MIYNIERLFHKVKCRGYDFHFVPNCTLSKIKKYAARRPYYQQQSSFDTTSLSRTHSQNTSSNHSLSYILGLVTTASTTIASTILSTTTTKEPNIVRPYYRSSGTFGSLGGGHILRLHDDSDSAAPSMMNVVLLIASITIAAPLLVTFVVATMKKREAPSTVMLRAEEKNS